MDTDGDGTVESEYVYGEGLKFAVQLDAKSELPVTVDYATGATGDTAPGTSSCPSHPGSPDEDYRHKTGSVAFDPGETSKTFTVFVCPDDQTETDEAFTVMLANPDNATISASADSAAGIIADNDPPEVYLAGPVSAAEGATLDFEVRLRQAAAMAVTVTVSTGADPAAAHAAADTGTSRDYLPKSGAQVTIPAGSVSATVWVFTIADTDDEHDETLLLRIDSVDDPAGGFVGSPDEAVGTIVDNDPPPEASIVDASAVESGPVAFTVALSAASVKPVAVTASTGASSPASAAGVAACVAVDGSDDYQTGSALVTFAAGVTTATFTVTVCDDTAIEPDETFTVTLSGAANATVSATAGTAMGVIVDDDTAVCAIWQQYDPATNTCIARTFFS